MNAKFTARIEFMDSNQPAVNVKEPTEKMARNSLSKLLREFAAVKVGKILQPDGSAAIFTPSGDYIFTITP